MIVRHADFFLLAYQVARRSVIAGLLIAEIFLPGKSKAQSGLVDPRKTEYTCVLARTALFVDNAKGNKVLIVTPCEAANVRQDSLIDADYTILEKMQLQRILFEVLKTRPNSESEARTTRADFLKFAKEVCARHPRIALLPLDWRSEQTRLSQITDAGGTALESCSAF